LYVDNYGDFPGSENQNVWFDPNVYSIANQSGQVTPPANQLSKVTFFGDWIANEIIANGENNYVAKHSYREYYNSETGLWVGWCKDYDGTFGSGDDIPAVSTTQVSNSNLNIVQPINVPSSLQIEYKGQLRSAYDLLLNQQQRNFLVDEETKIIYTPSNSYDWTTVDHSRWDAYQTYGEGNVDAQFQWYKNWYLNRGNYLLNNSGHGIQDNRIPNKPTISSTGTNALDNLIFSNSSFADPQGNNTFAALEWRVGEWSDPSNVIYDTKCKSRYEIEDHWVSGEINSFSTSFNIPAEAKLKVGRTYKVRVRYKDNTGRWSHWSDANTFIPQPANNQNIPNVIVNEINYNPADDCGSEFIEIYNNENYTVNLDNYEFSDGLDYEFPAGSTIAANSYLVIARDSIEFTQKYGFAPFGDYGSSLSNGGEQIILEGPYRTIVNNLTYADDVPWNALADGTGATLSLANPALDNANAFNWTASKNNCGTPGAENDICTDFQINETIFPVSCNGNNDGFINLSVTGGKPAYSYAWNNGSNSALILNLAPGNYSVTVTDKFLCSSTASYTITEPTLIQPNLSKTDETLFQTNDGSASLNVSGGVGPYTYTWSNGATTSSVNNLAPGSYSVTIMDDIGCSTVESFIINAITCPVLNLTLQVNDESYYQSNDGSATVNISNGTAPFVYNWSNGDNTNAINNLAPGNYSISITDSFGCPASENFTINPVICNPLIVDIDITDDSCAGDGLVVIGSITGGTLPYSILWSTGITGTVANNLVAGNYDLSITDVNGCPFNETYQVNSANNLTETVNITPASSNVATDGSIDITVTNGIAPYTYSWSNGSSNEDLNNASAGTYSVMITDANNCSKTVNNIVIAIDSCMPQIVQNNHLPITTGLFKVSNYIESNAIIDSNGNVSFKAGNYIELNDDFEVEQGAEFEAIIESCP